MVAMIAVQESSAPVSSADLALPPSVLMATTTQGCASIWNRAALSGGWAGTVDDEGVPGPQVYPARFLL
jgi:hypothetical protein